MHPPPNLRNPSIAVIVEVPGVVLDLDGTRILDRWQSFPCIFRNMKLLLTDGKGFLSLILDKET